MKTHKKRLKKIHIKLGDTVKVICGRHKGEIGKVKKIIKKNSKIKVENVNKSIKHVKPTQEGESGKIVSAEQPIHASNVMLHNNK